MRLILFFTVLSIAQVFADNSYSQNTKLSLDLQDVSVEKVLDEIETQSEFYFMFNQKLVDVNRKVNINVNNIRIKDILDKIFEGTETDFFVVDRQILLMPKNMAQNILYQSTSLKDSIKILGSVIDVEGSPLPGATVVVVGTTAAVITNLNGKFVLYVDQKDNVSLEVSFVGMVKKNVIWNGEQNLNIVLENSDQMIEEVYVTGYSTISKERSTGSYDLVTNEDLETSYSSSVSSLLEGKVAGVKSSGNNFEIRGLSTFNAIRTPLVVIDGLPAEGQFNNSGYNALNDINPNDIESITVLKDAAATSIYGARAANGVIVVTTKSAKANKTEVDFSSNFISTPKYDNSHLNQLSINNYIDYEKQYLENDPSFIADPVGYFDNLDMGHNLYSPVYAYYAEMARGNMTEAEAMAAIENLKGGTPYSNQYFEHALQNQLKQQYNLSFRSGSEKSGIVFSINALTNKGAQINSNSEKYTLFFKNNLKVTNWLNVNYGLNAIFGKNKYPALPRGSGMWSAYPYEQLVDENGERVYRLNNINPADAEIMENTEGLYSLKYNELDELDANPTNEKSFNTRMFLNANFKITDWLSYDAMFQYEWYGTSSKTYHDEDTYIMRKGIDEFAQYVESPWGPEYNYYNYQLPDGGSLYNSDWKRFNYTLRNQLNFNKKFGTDHDVVALAGFEMRENKFEEIRSGIYGYDDETLESIPVDWRSLSTGVQGSLYGLYYRYKGPSDNREEKMDRYISMYANAGYTYKGKYSLTGSFRIDQANLFGTDPKFRYRPLWSLGASWLASDESFMDISWVDMLKIRASYGVGGNVDRNTSPYMLAYVGNSYWTGYDVTAITNAPNPLLRWEKTTTYNAGIDFSLFKRKLNGSVDIYKRSGEDLLATVQFDPAQGFWQGVVNNGAMSNKGVEFSLSYNWIRNKDWSIVTNFTAAYNKNMVEKVDYEITYANELLKEGYYVSGAPYSSLYAYRYAGLTDEGDPSVHSLTEDGNDTIVSNETMQNHEALVNMGQTSPKWHGSFQPVIRYKGFELSGLLVFYTGHVKRDAVTPLYNKLLGTGGNVHGDMLNRWTPENTDTEIPRMSTYAYLPGRSDHWSLADVNVVDASSIHLRNIVFSYTLSQRWARMIKTNMVRLNFQVNNPWYSAVKTSNYTKLPIRPSYVLGINIKL
ncbi:MAG: SusC/RagA family TonB-linked outer membrane protein [Bacteroidota bacterium]